VLVKRFDRTDLRSLLNVNGKLVFLSSDSSNGKAAAIWKSDGTATGTIALQQLDSGVDSLPPQMLPAGPYLWFSNDDHSGIGVELWAIRSTIDTFVQTPTLAGTAPNSLATVPIQYGNNGIASASALTLTANLHPALTYVSDTSGITPTISGQTLTWRIADASLVSGRNFTLSVRTPNAAYGTRYPVALALAVAGQESYPADNTATIQVMIARQVYLSLASR
jgi:ELWxxDGT repeat protein